MVKATPRRGADPSAESHWERLEGFLQDATRKKHSWRVQLRLPPEAPGQSTQGRCPWKGSRGNQLEAESLKLENSATSGHRCERQLGCQTGAPGRSRAGDAGGERARGVTKAGGWSGPLLPAREGAGEQQKGHLRAQGRASEKAAGCPPSPSALPWTPFGLSKCK